MCAYSKTITTDVGIGWRNIAEAQSHACQCAQLPQVLQHAHELQFHVELQESQLEDV